MIGVTRRDARSLDYSSNVVVALMIACSLDEAFYAQVSNFSCSILSPKSQAMKTYVL